MSTRSLALAALLAAFAPVAHFAQAETPPAPTPVPVLGLPGPDGTTSDTPASPQPPLQAPKGQQQFQDTLAAPSQPATQTLTGEQIPIPPPSHPLAPKSLGDALKNAHSARVERVGGEGGSTFVRFRGARAFDPVWFLEGVPLSSPQDGTQSADLVPTVALSQLRLYPDTPPWWLPANGIAGSVQMEMCQVSSCPQGSGLGARVGSYGYRQLQGIHLWSSAQRPRTGAWVAANATHSDENFPHWDDGGTSIDTSDDGVFPRKNNDFARRSAVFSGEMTASFPGHLRGFFLWGDEKRGLAGRDQSLDTLRLTRVLRVGSASWDTTSASSGAQVRVQSWIRQEQSHLGGVSDEAVQFAPGNTLLTDGGARVVWEGLQWGFSLQGGESRYLAEKRLKKETLTFSSATGKARSLRVGAYWDWGPATDPDAPTPGQGWGLHGDLYRDESWMEANIPCAYVRQVCGSDPTAHAPALTGGTAALSYGASIWTVFLRYTHSERRPWMSELFGSGTGVVPNFTLKNEVSNTLEGGLSTPWTRTTLFMGRDENLISSERVNEALARFDNLSDVRRWGALASVFLAPWDGSELELGSQTTVSQFHWGPTNQSHVLPRTPRHTAFAEGRHTAPALWFSNAPHAQWGLHSRFAHQSPFWADFSNNIRVELPPEWDFGFFLGRLPAWDTSEWGIHFEALNLLDDLTGLQNTSTGSQYRIANSGWGGYPNPGRRFLLSASSHF